MKIITIVLFFLLGAMSVESAELVGEALTLTPGVPAITTVTPTPGVAQLSDASVFVEHGIQPGSKAHTVIGMVDLSSVISNIRASVLINGKGELFYGGHIPIVTFIGRKTGVEYVNINAGLAYSKDKNKSDFMMSMGIRIDSYISKLGYSYRNIRTASLPAIEVGPFVSYGFNDWMYGGMISIRLGK